jgi:hypothetical protein
MAWSPLQTRAYMIAFSVSSNTAVVFGDNVTLGYSFTLSSAVNVTNLRLFDALNDGFATSPIWFFLSSPPPSWFLGLRIWKRQRTERGEGSPPPDSNPFSNGEFAKNLLRSSRQFAASANRRFHFPKRRQLFIGVHNKTLSVIPMRIGNPD